MKYQIRSVFRIGELSDEAREKAIEKYRGVENEFFWSSEWMDSLKKGLEFFDCKLSDYSIDWSHQSGCYTKIEYPYSSTCDMEEISGNKLYSFIVNSIPLERKVFCKGNRYESNKKKWISNIQWQWKDCPFTGYCGDESFLYPIREFLKDPSKYDTLKDLMEACVSSLLEDACADYEYTQSDEYTQEQMEANDYWFNQYGDQVDDLFGDEAEDPIPYSMKDFDGIKCMFTNCSGDVSDLSLEGEDEDQIKVRFNKKCIEQIFFAVDCIDASGIERMSVTIPFDGIVTDTGNFNNPSISIYNDGDLYISISHKHSGETVEFGSKNINNLIKDTSLFYKEENNNQNQ